MHQANVDAEWFQFMWPEAWLEFHITVKELLPVVMSIAIIMHVGQAVERKNGPMPSGLLWFSESGGDDGAKRHRL